MLVRLGLRHRIRRAQYPRDLGPRQARHDGHARLTLAPALLDEAYGRDADGPVAGNLVKLLHGDSRVEQQFKQRIQYPLERADRCVFDWVYRARLTPTSAIHHCSSSNAEKRYHRGHAIFADKSRWRRGYPTGRDRWRQDHSFRALMVIDRA